MSIKIEIIDRINDFMNMHDEWDRVYSADAYANIFLSWHWLKAKFDVEHSGLYILSAIDTETDESVAFWPLKRAEKAQFGISSTCTLESAGAPFADYSGLLCRPDYAETAFPAFVTYLQTKLHWQSLNVNDSLDPRLTQVFASLSSGVAFETSNTACPCVTLASDWDTYLHHSISSSTRNKLRRKLRNMMQSDDFRFESITAENIAKNVGATVDLWRKRWQIKSEKYLNQMRQLLLAAAREEVLWLNAIWKGDEPVAMQLGFADATKQVIYEYFGGYNEAFYDFSPGSVVKAWSIKKAIEQGYKMYDFLRGAESYKYSFGAQDRIATTYRIMRRAN